MTIEEGIIRAKAFHAAGADVTLIDGLRSEDDVKRVADEVPGTKQINLIYGGKTPLWPTARYHELGFKVVLYSTPALYAITQLMTVQLKRLRESHNLDAISDVSMKFSDFQALMERTYIARSQAADVRGKSFPPGPMR
jgi:2-methylisocitrate lyase-like PEP mutase family enzyme